MDEKAKVKLRLQKRFRRIIRECEQLRIDKEWWNNNRTEHPPFDVGKDIVLANLARQILSHIDADRRVPDELTSRFQQEATSK